MSDVFPSLLTEAHKPDLLSGTNVLPYTGGGTETSSMPGGSFRSTDALPFPGGITADTSRHLDTIQARSAASEQLAARMASSVLLSNTDTAADKTGIAYRPTSPAGSAVASLPWIDLSGAVGGDSATDLTTGLPKLRFISDENALLTGASRNESAYNGVPKIDENGLEVTHPSSASKHLAQSRALALYASSQSAAYDHSVYGDASSAGMGSWGTGGAGGTIGGGGLTPGEAAELAVRVWAGKGPEWVQQILGVTLPSNVMNDFADVIHGAVKKHGESPAESIQRQRYNIASSEHGEQVRNAISREFYDRNLTPAEHKALAVQLADGTKTLAQFRKEAAYSDVARHRIADLFRQEHGFDATQQDLDYASMKTGDGWSLQDYRWSEAHSDRVTSKLKDIITAVQGRPVNAGDDVWIHAQQDSLGNGQQTIDQVRRG